RVSNTHRYTEPLSSLARAICVTRRAAAVDTEIQDSVFNRHLLLEQLGLVFVVRLCEPSCKGTLLGSGNQDLSHRLEVRRRAIGCSAHNRSEFETNSQQDMT